MVALQVLERRDQTSHTMHFPDGESGSPGGLLGSRPVQILANRPRQIEFKSLGQRPSQLAFFRAWHFRPHGREERVARSLSAIDAPNTISLDPETWRWIAEDIDIEDIGRD